MISDFDPALRSRREKLVLDHFAGEVAQEFDGVLATFPHPHYELIPTGKVHDGAADVMKYYLDSRTAFPDQHHEMIALRHSDDAVITEFWLIGTHLGPLGSVAPTGNKFRVRMNAFFIFEGDVLVCERIYFDVLTFMRQLIGEVSWKRPSSIVRLVRTVVGTLKETSSSTKAST